MLIYLQENIICVFYFKKTNAIICIKNATKSLNYKKKLKNNYEKNIDVLWDPCGCSLVLSRVLFMDSMDVTPPPSSPLGRRAALQAIHDADRRTDKFSNYGSPGMHCPIKRLWDPGSNHRWPNAVPTSQTLARHWPTSVPACGIPRRIRLAGGCARSTCSQSCSFDERPIIIGRARCARRAAPAIPHRLFAGFLVTSRGPHPRNGRQLAAASPSHLTCYVCGVNNFRHENRMSGSAWWAHSPPVILPSTGHWHIRLQMHASVTPANTRRSANVGTLLDQRRRQWANIVSTLAERLVYHATSLFPWRFAFQLRLFYTTTPS